LRVGLVRQVLLEDGRGLVGPAESGEAGAAVEEQARQERRPVLLHPRLLARLIERLECLQGVGVRAELELLLGFAEEVGQRDDRDAEEQNGEQTGEGSHGSLRTNPTPLEKKKGGRSPPFRKTKPSERDLDRATQETRGLPRRDLPVVRVGLLLV